MTKLNATFRRTEETTKNERAAYRRGATIAKYLFLTACGFALYRVGSVLALAERGYEATGGEVLLLLFPLLWYTVETMIKDAKQIHKIIKEERKNETSL